MQTASRPRISLVRIGSLPMFLTRSVPRGDGGVPDDLAKENKNLTGLLDRFKGDAMALAAHLLGENADLRSERRTLRTDLGAAQTKSLKDGQVAVSKEDGEALVAYKKLGTPEEIKTAKSERDTFRTDKDRLEGENKTLKEGQAKAARENQLREISDEVEPGVKWNAPVLARLDQLTPGLSFERRDVTENGTTFKRTFVKYKDGDGDAAPIKEMSAVQFAAENPAWKDFLPALQANAQGAGGGSQGGTDFLKQGNGGNNAGGNPYDTLRKNQEEANKAKTTSGKTVEQRLNMTA